MTGVSLTSAKAAFLVKKAWCLGERGDNYADSRDQKNKINENKIKFFCSNTSTPIIKILSS